MTEYGAAQSFIEMAFAYQDSECLKWPFGTIRGYGHIAYRGRHWLAPRLVCQTVHGIPPTPQHEAAHSCGDPSCVNPAHLRWATSKENKADKLGHGTEVFGGRNPSAKLTQDDVHAIRALRGKETCRSLAARFGIGRSQISAIQTGKAWPMAAH